MLEIHVHFAFVSQFFLFFFNDTATTEIYTLSLHDALPIFGSAMAGGHYLLLKKFLKAARVAHVENTADELLAGAPGIETARSRSEEHTSELQSQSNLVCRLLLEKKK